ncbi:MAG: methylated-DNA--[protein]-cysteine S-methyltransferase [Phycisphaerae bacterium]|nr:methylated-DNA--[protein]-cysteine S-methyltransferase [Phycisphaerae bacterium]MDP7636694.1 methylated-DNA--[protein]-cysteine S-methyltransferase [Phycisphaerae bacterium]
MSPKSPEDLHYATWPTAWGHMGAVAGTKGLRRVVLPHYQSNDLKALLAWHHPGAVLNEEPFLRFIELAREYFNSRTVDFSEVLCDLPRGESFTGKVLRACREIPYGQTWAYSQLASAIARPDSARAVATALSKNHIPLVIPCHRVIYADGRPGGFSAEGGAELKYRMLQLEAGGN